LRTLPVSFVASIAFAISLNVSTSLLHADQQPNSNATYRQLRSLLPAGPSVRVENFTLKRDAGVFTFAHGDFVFFGEVKGKVTGAVFEGMGHFHLTPPTAVEQHSLEILTKQPEFNEDFTQVILRFTDGAAEEIHKAATAQHGAETNRGMIQAAMEFHTFQCERLHDNIDLRILEDVLSPAPGGFFLAVIKSSGKPNAFFEIDLHGARHVAPEEVSFRTLNSWGWSYPAAFHLGSEYADGIASSRQENHIFKVDHEDLDTSIEKSGFLSSVASVHLRALQDSVAVVPFRLFPTLRVSKVEGEQGEVLDFIQEKKDDDPDFGVVLAHPLKKGETTVVQITYGGKDAVRNEGNDNYDPIAREDWFPNGGVGLGNYATYTMRFHVPKQVELIATGDKISDTVDGNIRTSDWDTKTPLPVVGFDLGRFSEKDEKTPSGLLVAAYANDSLPDWAAPINQGSDVVGQMSTKTMLPVEVSEGSVAVQIYERYFGKLSFDHIALAQQPACDYGQSWPMLVYLPICGFWDSTVKHVIGIGADDPYWKMVTAHEVAHQWWGHTVGFESYRDQWMSEGFADASASIFLQKTRKDRTDFRDYWKQLKEQLTQKNSDGFRPIEVGPVTMGFRLNSPKTGWNVYSNLVYPKGAYILHMIRVMMWSSKTGDDDFCAMMHDFVDTYRLKVATTEDFKAMVEKHMTPGMNLTGNHRMDWFFDEYVYGTEIPRYHFESKMTPDGDKIQLHIKLVQSGVSPTFRMLVPAYLELTDGQTVLLGRAAMVGNSTVERNILLEKPPSPIKRVSIDSMHDLLAIDN
jgi:hypothetical protein